MNLDPISNIQALRRVQADIGNDARAVSQALQRVPAIQDLLAAVLLTIEQLAVAADSLDQTAKAQAAMLVRMQRTMTTLEKRAARIELAVVDLQAKANTAVDALPDPNDDNRGALEKARDVITGS